MFKVDVWEQIAGARVFVFCFFCTWRIFASVETLPTETCAEQGPHV